MGLTYDVSFELNLFDRLGRGWFHVNVTSTPQKIHEALAASLRVLRGLNVQPLAQRELLRARRTLLTRHESDLKVRLFVQGIPGVPCLGMHCSVMALIVCSSRFAQHPTS